MIEHLLAAAVVGVEAFDDPPDAVLYPEEENLLARAVDARRREFRTVRQCARTAMRRLGLPPAPVLPGASRQPRWPAGVVGSMTHCTGYRAAALALASEVHAVGIDAEPHEALPAEVLAAIATDAERAALPGAVAHEDRILFCAKETVYKAWFPIAARWLGFEDAHVTLAPSAPVSDAALPGVVAKGTFTARLLVPGPSVDGAELTRLDGRWLVGAGLVLTAIALPVVRRPAAD